MPLPWLIWFAGQSMLGPYARGGVFAFFGDFFAGLAQGSLVFWTVALGPVLFLVLVRLFWFGVRATR